MFKRKSKAFTLIELIATLVIMAIIALIVTPLVMTIIRKARISADKRSIDAYGRSIELAISSHLLDTGKFATSIDELTIEYSGNKVECETTQINPDSSVYLSNCKVNNRDVTNYTYGTDKSPSYEAYSVGDEVTYNGVDYYVLKDSGVKDNVVTLLKATPLTTDEVNLYGGVGTDDNHVNKYTGDSQGTAYNFRGYGGVAYYSSDTCGYNNNSYLSDGCKTDYESSDIKYVVDAWSDGKASINLKKVRLLTFEELINNLGYEYSEKGTDIGYFPAEFTPLWVKNVDYNYWTMSTYNDSAYIWCLGEGQKLMSDPVYGSRYSHTLNVIRPVVELYKNDGITRKNSGNN